MFDWFYHFQHLGPRETFLPNPTRKILYRFRAKHRFYLVELEVYRFGVVAVKFCPVKDKDSSKRFEKIYNEQDAVRIITTCLHVMRDYWSRNPDVTFAFYAIPRNFDPSVVHDKNLTPKQLKKFIDRYVKVRYTIYDYAMINLFPSSAFTHFKDSKNSLYVLLNKKQKKPVTTLRKLGGYLLEQYKMIFEPDETNV